MFHFKADTFPKKKKKNAYHQQVNIFLEDIFGLMEFGFVTQSMYNQLKSNVIERKIIENGSCFVNVCLTSCILNM